MFFCSGTVDPENPESSNNFEVEVRVFLVAAAAAGQATVSVTGSWSSDAIATTQVQLRESTATAPQLATLALHARNVPLWWPVGMGPSTQTLHNLTTTLALGSSNVQAAAGAASAATATDTATDTSAAEVRVVTEQKVGFRTFEFVGSVGNKTARHGNKNASLWFQVNGAPLFSKGNNWMPSSVPTPVNMSVSA